MCHSDRKKVKFLHCMSKYDFTENLFRAAVFGIFKSPKLISRKIWLTAMTSFMRPFPCSSHYLISRTISHHHLTKNYVKTYFLNKCCSKLISRNSSYINSKFALVLVALLGLCLRCRFHDRIEIIYVHCKF